jgi:tetrachlorobenzoquinone reductase
MPVAGIAAYGPLMQVVRSITAETAASESDIHGQGARVQIDVRLTAIRYAARDINLYEFSRVDGGVLPSFAPGAHIDLHLPNGIMRQYSLIECEAQPRCYVIGVKLDPQSRGGSKHLHREMRVGQALKISSPRNNFPLIEAASHSILIAGGIGVTPIWCMWNRLQAAGKSAQLYYSSRSRQDVVFPDKTMGKPHIVVHVDDENQGTTLDLQRILAEAPKNAHVYCCGPTPMLKAFELATTSWPPDQVHVEYFSSQVAAAAEGGFTVELKRSGKEVKIEPGQTILQALTAMGIDAPYSCEEGVCGACMTKVLSGEPDHRDSVLTPAERASNKKIMICCSGSKSDRLVLDL